MKLIGKAKVDFEEWFKKQEWYLKKIDATQIIDTNITGWVFRELPESMQNGVYVEFFDSVGIHIEIQLKVEPVMEGAKLRSFRPELLYKNRYYGVGASFGSRKAATGAAIVRANTIYNKNEN